MPLLAFLRVFANKDFVNAGELCWTGLKQRAMIPPMKVHTVTGEVIKLSRCGGLCLNYGIECGHDWIADVQITDGAKPKNNRRARVFVSKNPGVAQLMSLAWERGALKIKSLRSGF